MTNRTTHGLTLAVLLPLALPLLACGSASGLEHVGADSTSESADAGDGPPYLLSTNIPTLNLTTTTLTPECEVDGVVVGDGQGVDVDAVVEWETHDGPNGELVVHQLERAVHGSAIWIPFDRVYLGVLDAGDAGLPAVTSTVASTFDSPGGGTWDYRVLASLGATPPPSGVTTVEVCTLRIGVTR